MIELMLLIDQIPGGVSLQFVFNALVNLLAVQFRRVSNSNSFGDTLV